MAAVVAGIAGVGKEGGEREDGENHPEAAAKEVSTECQEAKNSITQPEQKV